MTYRMAMNAKCEDGFKRYKWAKLGRTGASQSSNAIDELGRMFTWGQNIDCESGQGDPSAPSLEYIEYATQVSPSNNWVKVTSGEESTIAINILGELWGWGEKGYDECSSFGLPPGSGDIDAGDTFSRPTLCTPGYLWKDVAHNYYYTLAIGVDNKLYTFGRNVDEGLGMNLPNGYIQATPLLNTYLTNDIKLIDCEYDANVAVTVDNKVYIWGDSWAYPLAGGYYDTPTELTGLPVGAVVEQISCSYYGVIVLLEDGTVWAAGEGDLFGDNMVAYPAGTATFEQVTSIIPKGEVTLVRTTALGAFSVVIIANGNIWSWGDSIDGYMGNSLPYTWGIPMLCAVEYENQYRFIDAVHNTHNNVFQTIDYLGYLWTWGSQWWGPHLAIGAADTQYLADQDPNITDIVHRREFAGYAEDAVLRNGDPALLNVFSVDDSEYLQPLPQMLRHRPCGHWHLRDWEAEDLWPQNCWMPSVSIYENHLMFVACGKHLQVGVDTGCEVLIFDYDIDANIWTLAMYGNAINAANHVGGASIYDDTMVFANYKADATGTAWYDEHYANFCLGVWVLDRGNDYDMNYTEFAMPERYMQGKVAAYSGGIAAVAYEDVAEELLVQVTTDYGATWNLRKTVGALAARKDWSIAIDKNGYIFLAHQISANHIMVERTIDNGLNWTTRIASNYMVADINMLKLVADNDMLFLFASSLVATAIERSSNGGTSWSTVPGEPLVNPHVASGCNVDDSHDDIAFVTSGLDLNNYLYNTDYGGYDWLTRTIPQISEEGDEINTYQGPLLADINGYNGRFAYSAYTFYSIPVPYVAVAISVDKGVTWSVRSSPLGWASGADELGDFKGCPLFCLTDVPHLNHIWTFEKSNWAAEFVKQKDKYKVERPCVCPQYRGT